MNGPQDQGDLAAPSTSGTDLNATSAGPRWIAYPGANLSWHRLGDACVVHHALTNDTHVLGAWIEPVLAAVSAPNGALLESLSQDLQLDPGTLAQALMDLATLHLVRPC